MNAILTVTFLTIIGLVFVEAALPNWTPLFPVKQFLDKAFKERTTPPQ